MKTSLLNLVVAASDEAIVMVEASAKEVSEATILDAIQFAHEQIRKIVAAERELFEKLGVKKREFAAPARDESLYQERLDRRDPTRGGRPRVYPPYLEDGFASLTVIYRSARAASRPRA